MLPQTAARMLLLLASGTGYLPQQLCIPACYMIDAVPVWDVISLSMQGGQVWGTNFVLHITFCCLPELCLEVELEICFPLPRYISITVLQQVGVQQAGASCSTVMGTCKVNACKMCWVGAACQQAWA